jgi:hypothetical protein
MAKAKECCDELTPSERSALSLLLTVENTAMSGRILDIDGLFAPRWTTSQLV